MKTALIKSLVMLGGLGGTFLFTGLAAPAPEYRTEVVFFEREKFTDVRDQNFDNDKNRDAILEQLKTYLQERAQLYVPEGAKLSVTIKDVDMAGEFEPWRTPAGHDVRIVKEIYAPRIKLAFQFTDANGEVVKQGTRDLRNLDFMRNSFGNFNEPYRYEKALIDDWLRAEFPRAKKNTST
ncbi:MAG TPA: DUF3016 domain-containing protein [Opitutaceae bacterium]|nr:DUF3016 domain-containing protein [Opitutaceae bacterium]